MQVAHDRAGKHGNEHGAEIDQKAVMRMSPTTALPKRRRRSQKKALLQHTAWKNWSAASKTPRRIWIMLLPEKRPMTRSSRLPFCPNKGDIIIDGGNSSIRMTSGRAEALAQLGIVISMRGVSAASAGLKQRLLPDDRRSGKAL
jgi:6-phosphogluconate dehydrogenase